MDDSADKKQVRFFSTPVYTGGREFRLCVGNFFSIKSQIINSLGSADSTVFAIAIPLCYCSLKDAIDNILMRKYGYNSIKLY